MKLYTEEQVKEAYNKGRTDWINEIEDNNILYTLIPIELPSRDMAEEAFTNSSLSDSKEDKIYFINGFIWTIRQILNQNK